MALRARARDHPRARARRGAGSRDAADVHDGAARCDFLAMGGYGFYVWGAYGVTALAIVDRGRARVRARCARRARAAAAPATTRSSTTAGTA